MSQVYPAIDDPLRKFIEAQRVFFVASAPLGGDGHVNLSPTGLDTLRILGPTRVAYIDYCRQRYRNRGARSGKWPDRHHAVRV
jgi:hypothetical protein